jgi:predicted site-specific integrase-resolvase
MSTYPDAPTMPRVGGMLTADDVAALLGVSRTLIDALSRRGVLPTVWLDERHVRCRAQTMAQRIAECESTSPKDMR